MSTSRQVSTGRARSATVRKSRRTAAALSVGVLLGSCLSVIAVDEGTALASPVPTSSVPSSSGPEYYLALGDSLAAGVGSPDGKGYVADIYAKEHKKISGLVLENLACSGATTTSMINGPGCSYMTGTQLGDAEAFLEAHGGEVAFITIDIGANDLVPCIDGAAVNTACVTAGMSTVGANLPDILSALTSAGGSTPIVGMSYYDPFLADWLTGSSGESLAEQTESVAAQLDTSLAGYYGTALTAGVENAFKTGDFHPGGRYDAKAVPVNVGRICAWTLMCSEQNIHANDIGHAHIATAFEKILGPLVDSVRRARHPTSVSVGTSVSAGNSATAGKSATPVYDLALGDSLAAGGGSPDAKGYVIDLFDHEKKHDPGLVLEKLSCDGASTTSMMYGPGCSYATGTQLGDAEAFLKAHVGHVAFVTIDIGANDIDACADATAIDTACVAGGLNSVTVNTPKIVSGLEAAAGSTPIVGMTYYDPFLADWLMGSSGRSVAEQSESIAEELNAILVQDFGATETADVQGSFKTSNFSPGGHFGTTAVPVNVGRICAWTNMCTEGDFHADDAGHARIAKAYEKTLRPLLAAAALRLDGHV